MGRCHLLEQNGQYNIDQKNSFYILFTIEIRYEIRQDLVSNLIICWVCCLSSNFVKIFSLNCCSVISITFSSLFNFSSFLVLMFLWLCIKIDQARISTLLQQWMTMKITPEWHPTWILNSCLIMKKIIEFNEPQNINLRRCKNPKNIFKIPTLKLWRSRK